MPESYLPPREADLLGFAENFSTKLSGTPAAYGILPAQATAFAALFSSFQGAMSKLQDPTTKSPPFVAAKNTAKEDLVDGPGGIRELVALVQAHPAITDEQLVDLRLTVRDRQPSPVPAPASAPVFIVKSQVGRTIFCRLGDAEDDESRGKPAGVIGASVLMFVGDQAPANPMQWTLAKNVSKTTFELDLGAEVPGGAKVWLSAFWFNLKQELSAPATPVSVRVADTLAQAA